MSTAEKAITFDQLLLQYVEQQMAAVERGEEIRQYLTPELRKKLLEQLMIVQEGEEKTTPFFDNISLTLMAQVFAQADEFQKKISEDEHPASLLYGNPQGWFCQSYGFMFSPVSFIELIRFFGAGRNKYEKEIIFRTQVAKLIKTQDTVRKISANDQFIEKYMNEYPDFARTYPEFQKKTLKLSKSYSYKESLLKGMFFLVRDVSIACLNVFSDLNIALPSQAKMAFDRKRFYEALILTMRHSKGDLFETVLLDQYPTLVKSLTNVIQQSFLHPELFMFQHIKRQYMMDWLVFTLREYDKEHREVFYQAGKSGIYKKFTPLDLSEDTLNALKIRERLIDNEVIAAECEALSGLEEASFYELLLRIYTRYKDDHLLGKGLPMAAQALSSGGDISWDKQNMVAQVSQKMEEAKKDPSKAKHFQGMLLSLKKVVEVFTHIVKKQQDAVEASKAKQSETEPEEEPINIESAEPEPPPPPVFEVLHSGVLLEPCFPLRKGEVLEPVKGQRQDRAFKDSDDTAAVAPTEQEYIVNFFNITNEKNLPINKYYNKFSNATMAILRTYEKMVEYVTKKISVGGNVSAFTEDLLYLKITDSIILTLGNTNMGQSPNIGKLQGGKTAYFRLFLGGDLAKILFRTNSTSYLKAFRIGENVVRFKEVQLEHFRNKPQLEALMVHAYLKVIESLPQDQFDFLNDESLIGFVSILQHKANQLKAKGADFNKTIP
ncbi:hypothetical protein WDW89_15420 [Deltaproteobacteria bacterium TL4]